MAGSARLSSRNAIPIAPSPSSANGQVRQGFGYQDMVPINNLPTNDALLGLPRRNTDHRPVQPLSFPSQQQQREMSMKRRISVEMEHERERERAVLLERGRADRLLVERAARIASGGAGLGGGLHMYEGDGMLPLTGAAERSARMDEAGILGSNASLPVLERRAELHTGAFSHKDTGFNKVPQLEGLDRIHAYERRSEIDMGSPLHTGNAMDRGSNKMEFSKGQEKLRSRAPGMLRGMENSGMMDIPRGTENSRILEIARGAEESRSSETFGLSNNMRGRDFSNVRGVEHLRGMNPKAMEVVVGRNSRSLEFPDQYRGLEIPESRRSSEVVRVGNKPVRGLENSKHLINPLAAIDTMGDSRVDNNEASEGGFDAGSDEGKDQSTFKPSLRQSSQERNMLLKQKQVNNHGRDIHKTPAERPPFNVMQTQELVAQYKMALAELTFNSKPIITNLTIIAGENLHASEAIASTVCAHILEVPVEQKLPSLYLLDSIVKNISSSYVKHFAARLPEVFIRSYRQVDPALHPAMQHLFKTWRGVFNIEPLREIERELQLGSAGNDSLIAAPPSNSARLSKSPQPQQRPGHGIHVNPKYLEAQRQKLQQAKQFPARGERDDAVVDEAVNLYKSSSSLPEFDYSTLSDKGGSNVERKKAQGVGLPTREDAMLRGMESSSYRYGVRNGYDIQRHSPRALIDAYGNVRGMRASRSYVQPADEMGKRDRDLARDWQSAEEEEYSWGDINRGLLDADDKSRREKDDWLQGDAEKTFMPGSSSLPEQQPSGQTGWGKHRAWAGVNRPASAENLCRRDVEERTLMQDSRPLSSDNRLEETSLMGAKGHSFAGCQPLAGYIEPLSPPTQPRLLPMQGERNSPLSSLAKFPKVYNSAPKNSEGLAAAPPFLVSHSLVPADSGPVVGGINMRLEALSSVVPGPSLNIQQSQFPSPPSLGTGSQVDPPLHPLNPVGHSQPSSSSLKRHSFPPNPLSKVLDIQPPVRMQYQGPPASDMRSQGSRPPPLIPKPVLPVQQTREQMPEQPLAISGPVPVLPQIPSHLLDSLQQLHRHLPALSQGITKVSPPFQMQDSSQEAKLQQSSQLSAGKLSIPQGQELPQISAPLASMPFVDALQLPLQAHANVNTSRGWPAFQQSTSKPLAQGPQNTSELLASSFLLPRMSDPIIQASLPLPGDPPPLPSGPPPPSMGTTTAQPTVSAPAVSIAKSNLPALAPIPLQPAGGPPKLMQPPLPPGPPPPSQQTKSILQLQPPSSRPPSSGNDLNSLLSSLMAQGVLSVPTSVPIPAQHHGAGLNVSSGLLGLNPSSTVPVMAAELSTKMLPSVNALVPQTSSATNVDDKGTTRGFDGTEFNQEFLRERHQSVIQALYSDFPRQCTTCGLRFKYQEEHSEHMDWHVSRNRRQKSSKKVSRKWFVNTNEWLSGTGATSSEVSPAFFAEVAEKAEEPEKLVAVPADENQVTCALCGEPFEDFYSDEIDEWMYKGAVYLNVPPGGSVEGMDKALLGPIVHANCRSESAAGTAGDLAEDAAITDSFPHR